MKKILTRSISGAIYVAIIVVSIYLGQWIGNFNLGDLVFIFLITVIGMIGVHEAVSNLHKSGRQVNRVLCYFLAAMVFLTFIGCYIFTSAEKWAVQESAAKTSLMLSIGLLLLMPTVTLILELFRNEKEPFASVGHTLLSVIWVVIPMISLIYIHTMDYKMLMLLFILIWVNDTFAYLTGMKFGKHKMWERHSPNKTWEGTFGGLFFCLLAAIFIGPVLTDEHSRILLAIIGLVSSVFGTLGDLVESMFKRSCGIKDSGNIMPGHGGILDRFDSLLASAPFLLAILLISNIQ